ncbi:TlpA disulfide reductase family protein [Lutimonas halocynthiae]|uniref:TlpA disulfide reductase family protein n=1 Tax=Lutimonas halocynthiae TaxID=1446477 RepID=UPI0025B2DB0A|nr:TlpA disulfide reductase family protein [Lutimonas halocynthiae]MDN3641318.1 TlpA disulfide reductase family protein [Lutimonas halocynthiae]
MKYYIIILSLFAFLSCKKHDAEKISSKQTVNDEIEVYSFEEFELFLEEDEDQIYIINFWATWCKPCIQELPYFEAAQKMHKEDVKVILLSLDFTNKLESQLIPFVKKNSIQSQVILLDDPHENEWIPKVDSTWSGAIPATLMIKGSKRKFYEQSFSEKELENEILNFKNL